MSISLRLINRAKAGDNAAFDQIVKGIRGQMLMILNKYFIQNGDKGDIKSAALQGLWSAIQCYNSKGGSQFESFAYFCMLRKVQSIVKSSLGERDKFYRNCVSLDLKEAEDSEGIYNSVLDENVNIVQDVIAKLSSDTSRFDNYAKATLTRLELSVYSELPDIEFGDSYDDVAQRVAISRKQVDNTLYRIRTKFKRDWPEYT